MAASRYICTKGFTAERRGQKVSVQKGDLVPANSPLRRGHEDNFAPADFPDQVEAATASLPKASPPKASPPKAPAPEPAEGKTEK